MYGNFEGIILEQTQSESIGNLALALSKAQGELSGAKKDSDNPFFKSKYADLHQCIEAAREPLAKNELAVIQTTRDSDKGVTIITTLAHSSGEWIRGELTMKPKKDDDQSRGSSITYGRRYTQAAIIGLAQKDDDGNESVKKPGAKQQPEKKCPANNGETVKRWADWLTDAVNKGCTKDTLEVSFKTSILSKKEQFSPEDFKELEDLKNDLAKEIQQRI